MDVVGVMAEYSDLVRACVCVCGGGFSSYTVNYTHAQQVRICCHNTDYVNGHDRTILVILAKYCIRLPDDGSFVIRIMLEHFLNVL